MLALGQSPTKRNFSSRLTVVIPVRAYFTLGSSLSSGMPRSNVCQWLRGRIWRNGTYLYCFERDLSVSLLGSGKVSTRNPELLYANFFFGLDRRSGKSGEPSRAIEEGVAAMAPPCQLGNPRKRS